MLKVQLRWLALMLALVLGIAISIGCGMRSGMLKSEKEVESSPPYHEHIIGIEPIEQHLGDEVITLVGEQYTYEIFKGAKELDAIATNLNSSQLRLDNSPVVRLYSDRSNIWGEMTIYFTATENEGAEVKRALGKLMFKHIKGQVYARAVNVGGKVLGAAKLPASIESTESPKQIIKISPTNTGAPRYLKECGLGVPMDVRVISHTIDSRTPKYIGLPKVEVESRTLTSGSFVLGSCLQ